MDLLPAFGETTRDEPESTQPESKGPETAEPEPREPATAEETGDATEPGTPEPPGR